MDLLRPAEVDAHFHLLSFLKSLRGLAPTILIGQRLPLEADFQCALNGLPLPAIQTLLLQTQISPSLSNDALEQLQAVSGGNPRLLKLFIALYQSGESADSLINLIRDTPSLEFLLKRLQESLNKRAQKILAALTAFRRFAPGDVWSAGQAKTALNALLKRQIAHSDGRGGVAILPAFREIIYQSLPSEDKDAAHLKAAAIRIKRGEYTAAAHHYLQAGQPETAIRLWYDHLTEEVNQGQAVPALTLFKGISRNRLKGENREKLVLLRSELRKITGEYAAALDDLIRTFWRSPILKAKAKRLEGDIADLKSDYGRALRAYEDGLQLVQPLLENEMAIFHKNRGWIYTRQKNLNAAWREAQFARYEADNLQGFIQKEMGNYKQAEKLYWDALNLAQDLKHLQGEAKTRNNLASLLARQGKLDEAMANWEKACQQYKSIGKQSSLASIRVNQAFAYNLAGQAKAAVSPAIEALKLFQRFEQSYGQAVAAQNLAEAHLALGNLRQAEEFAWQVIHAEENATIPDGLRTLGEVRLRQGQFDEAEKLISQSIALAEENQDRFLSAYGHRALGEVYMAQGQVGEAGAVLGKAIALFEELELPREVKQTQRSLPK